MATIIENIQTLNSIKTDIKDAIISKGVSVGNDFRTYAQAITDLPSGGGGGTEMEDALVQRTLSVYYSNDRVSKVGSYAFFNCTALTSVYMPKCSYIDDSAFNSCTNLTQVYLNSVSIITKIYSDTFSNCPNLTSVYVPASLVDAFKVASYWSSLSSKIVAYTEG